LLAKAPACRRIEFETGRMAPMLYHGLAAFGLPVVCIESRQAYQALKSLATDKTDRNDARGLAHLARTGFFKPVHVKSRPAHAIRALIVARKKLSRDRGALRGAFASSDRGPGFCDPQACRRCSRSTTMSPPAS
jgi:transposase